MSKRFVLWVLMMTVAAQTPYGEDQEAQQLVRFDQRAAEEEMTVSYIGGLLSAKIRDVSLGDVVEELWKEAGIRIDVSDAKLLSQRLSMEVSNVDLSTALKVLLDGHSYLLSHPADPSAGPVVRILSTGQGLTATWWTSPPSQPWDGERASEGDIELKSALQTLRLAETEAARLEAIECLVDAKSAGATAALIEQALGEGSASFRVGAVDALWRHAADREFSDASAGEALEYLSNDNDNAVRTVARRALADMEQYMTSSAATASLPGSD